MSFDSMSFDSMSFDSLGLTSMLAQTSFFLRDEDPIEPKPEGGLAKFYDVAVPDEDDDSQNEGSSWRALKPFKLSSKVY